MERELVKNARNTVNLFCQFMLNCWVYGGSTTLHCTPYAIENEKFVKITPKLLPILNNGLKGTKAIALLGLKLLTDNKRNPDNEHNTLENCIQVMGSSQTKSSASAAAVDGAANDEKEMKTKSQRGSRVKVFGRFTHKKPTKDLLTPVSTATTVATSSFPTSPTSLNFNDAGDCDVEYSKDKLEQLLQLQQQQRHAAILQQLERNQMNFSNIQIKNNKKNIVLQTDSWKAANAFNACEIQKQKQVENQQQNKNLKHQSATKSGEAKDETDVAENYYLFSKMQLTGGSLNDGDVVVLKEISSSSDSLFTDPLSARAISTRNEHNDITWPPCDILLNLDDKLAARHKLSNSNNERPLSIFSTASYDTSGILSPTTARAVAELKRRHQADKLSELSCSKIIYLEISATHSFPTDPSPAHTENSEDGPDEFMAAQLGKKLAHVLSNTSTKDMNTLENNMNSTTSCADMFNGDKVKKVELNNLSTSKSSTNMNADGLTKSVTSQTAKSTSESSTATSNSTTAAYSPVTPSSNVLQKVASFTLDKTTAASALDGGGSIMSTGSTSTQAENARRISCVPEKLSFAVFGKFEGQMLMKWFISSYQQNNNNSAMCLNEQDLNLLTVEYCNNLLKIGVLKQISEKNDDELFSPFKMYQWSHTETPITTVTLTPGKLEKTIVWPYTTTPTSTSRAMKSVQTGTVTGFDNQWLQELKRRLLSCATLQEAQRLIDEYISAAEDIQTQRRPSKCCSMQLKELLNTNETTLSPILSSIATSTTSLYRHVPNTSENKKSIATQTLQFDLERSDVKLCFKCANGIQEEATTTKDTTAENKISSPVINTDIKQLPPPAPPPLPPPPPPMPPCLFTKEHNEQPNTSAVAPPPPPPPPSTASSNINTSAPVPPPPPSYTKPPPLSITTSTPSKTAAPAAQTTPPPPPPPQTPSANKPATPAPLPNASECGWFQHGNNLRKHAVNPPKPMKPLYWTRIVTSLPPVKSSKSGCSSADVTDSNASSTSSEDAAGTAPKEIWQEIEETSLDNIDEFTELFSRQAQAPVTKPKQQKEIRSRTIKVLDSKRSQNVGIVARTLHVDFCEIEHAIYHVDTSVVSLETLQHIINIKATNEELELIKEAAQGDLPLDLPEQFLLKISQISMFTERISCIVFQAEFEEATTIITRKLETVIQLSQYIIESEDLKLVFSIILTLGNYMNGGNRARGQADGFTLEILGKLKDVKSKESNTTLLHFIVRTYIARRRKEGVQLTEMVLPIPEPSDVERATQVDFDELKKLIMDLNKKLKSCKKTTEKVILASTEETLQPFKDKMEEFIESALKTIDKLYKDLDDCRDIFIDTMRFYHFTPKTRTLEECTPDQFFEYWTNFTNDFKDIWKKEIATLWNELMKKSKNIQNERKTVKTTKIKPGGLKERILRLTKK